MKPVLLRVVAIESVLSALTFLAAQTQSPPADLTTLNIEDHRISLGLVGQILLRNLHQEYAGPDLTVLPNLIRRSAYTKITWRF
jgi:hypothetical protein